MEAKPVNTLTPRIRRGLAEALRWMDEHTLTSHAPPHLAHYRALRRGDTQRVSGRR
jgi:hypothetical protein